MIENNDNTKDFAEIDLDREQRTGFPEVIFGETKTPEQSALIAEKIYNKSNLFLITRTNIETFNEVKKLIPEAEFDDQARMIFCSKKEKNYKGRVSVVNAGTSDIPIAKEAEITAKLMGVEVESINDVGVTGIHRILGKVDKIKKSNCIVVVAGMEGALPTVVAGLVDKPVIAVPTSVGFGTGADGYSALLTMLNSCAPGISVVNIDAGFSAGYQAALIARG
ncbi:MAG: nickel pincer cofactor biosynthesis protein LarB [SAR202 cluster bacterium]|nr:1-(5-phosphoribosyl)-5-amino-4-imidazole-carboxylate carboxylase [Chloroflexota bacterium]MQF83280.1 nickel pincer cofactor biosynthesis protein LarB [SAR202 cluster bacterium]|tara:strand:- start:1713 stop:2378 length:666 start_codon:yes stop_codon:yes gene_type:complete